MWSFTAHVDVCSAFPFTKYYVKKEGVSNLCISPLFKLHYSFLSEPLPFRCRHTQFPQVADLLQLDAEDERLMRDDGKVPCNLNGY